MSVRASLVCGGLASVAMGWSWPPCSTGREARCPLPHGFGGCFVSAPGAVLELGSFTQECEQVVRCSEP